MNREIPVRTIDMSVADGYAVTPAEVVLNALLSGHFGKKKLLFSGLKGTALNTLLEQGTIYPKSKYIYALEEIVVHEHESILTYAEKWKQPMIAVYDANCFKSWDFPGTYEFKEPNKKRDALLAVYLLKY